MSLIRHRDMTKTFLVFVSTSLSSYVVPGMEYEEIYVGFLFLSIPILGKRQSCISELISFHFRKNCWWERVGQAESVEKSWKNINITKLAKLRRKTTTLVYAISLSVCYFFKILVSSPIIMFVMIFQFILLTPNNYCFQNQVIPPPDRLGLVDKTFTKLYMVYSDFIQEIMIRTKHCLNLNSGFTKIGSEQWTECSLQYNFSSLHMYSGALDKYFPI